MRLNRGRFCKEAILPLKIGVHFYTSTSVLRIGAESEYRLARRLWLQPSWTLASDWFWKTAVERNHFSNLLEHAWRHNFAEIRGNPEALKAFKTLTLKLAVYHVPIALEVQQQI